ncbi:MAG: PEP-CTERM sorting domain-containing protein [Lentisphaeria bacterium]|nr:PEP-CTERM sorting domain-containing protein [Lentisphaeria bacterium]
MITRTLTHNLIASAAFAAILLVGTAHAATISLLDSINMGVKAVSSTSNVVTDYTGIDLNDGANFLAVVLSGEFSVDTVNFGGQAMIRSAYREQSYTEANVFTLFNPNITGSQTLTVQADFSLVNLGYAVQYFSFNNVDSIGATPNNGANGGATVNLDFGSVTAGAYLLMTGADNNGDITFASATPLYTVLNGSGSGWDAQTAGVSILADSGSATYSATSTQRNAVAGIELLPLVINHTWKPGVGGDGTWTTQAGNEFWDNPAVVWTDNANAIFATANGTSNIVTLGETINVENIDFQVDGYEITGAQTLNVNGTVTVGGTDTATFSPSTVAGSIEKAGDGTLSFNTAGTQTVSADITGSAGTLQKTGAGTTVFSGDIDGYSGAIDIAAGTLEYSGSDPLTLNNTLTGNAGTTLLLSGGSLVTVTGDTTGFSGDITGGTLVVADGVTLNAGAINVDTIGGKGTIAATSVAFDRFWVDPSGPLNFGSLNVDFSGLTLADLENTAALAPNTYVLAVGTGTFTYGSGDEWNPLVGGTLASGRKAYFQVGSLELVVIPEPSTIILAGLGLAGLTLRRRRK